MWEDYDAGYSAELLDRSFLAWREAGARNKARNIVRVCRGIKVQLAIEIGCGTGAVLRNLQALRFAQRYACLDVSVAAVQYTQHSCGGSNVEPFVGSASGLPFLDYAFDVAILSHVIEHLNDPAAALLEASRVARFVVVEVPTEDSWSNSIRRHILGRTYASVEGAGHVQFWSSSSIEAFLERSCGLEIVSRHCDRIAKEIEYFGKSGFGLAKPFLKQALKAAIPLRVYARLLTTHSTFLCQRVARQAEL